MTGHERTSRRLFGRSRLFGRKCAAGHWTFATLSDAMTTGIPQAPHDLAERALSSMPVYGSIQVALHVGGERYAVAPLSAPVFASGPGLSLEDLRLAVVDRGPRTLPSIDPWQLGWVYGQGLIPLNTPIQPPSGRNCARLKLMRKHFKQPKRVASCRPTAGASERTRTGATFSKR
jgi:hypothetical protein